jgi:hypothetical protein
MTQISLSKALSRRSILAAAGCMVGASAAATLTVTEAGAQAKVAQASVAYQATPKGDQQCDNCIFFQAPNACKTVAGDIAPQGWCKIWAKKPS